MKKKISVAIIIAVIAINVFAGAVLAGSPSPPDYGNWNPTGLDLPPIMEEWGLEKALPSSSAPGGEVHIVTDPLVGVESADGWITFWCQSKIGLQYNVGATGLNPLSRYSVQAIGIQATIVPPGTPGAIELGEGLFILIPPNQIEIDLGSFKTDANGQGGVKGVEKLPSGYLYEVGTIVFDGDGIPVLWSPADDTNGFIVY